MNTSFLPPFFFDGAFGTYYHQLTGDTASCEWANQTSPDRVLQIHREYLEAGARGIKTNTYGVNSLLAPPEEALPLLDAGYALACRAAAPFGAQVFADIGYLPLDEETAVQEYLRLARRFLSLGAVNFLFETLAEYSPILPAVREIRALCPDAQILVSFAVSQDGYTKKGYFYRTLLARAQENPDITLIGLNCLCGPSHMLGLVRKLGPLQKPLCAMPNAGYPSSVGGRTFYQDNAEYFSDRLLELYTAGADFIGGCCGSTPRHIRLAAEKISAHPRVPDKPMHTPLPAASSPATPSGGFGGSGKLIAVELDPPVDADCSFVLTASQRLRECSADLITIADSPLSRTRADSLMTAAKIRRETGVQVLPHISCRDKNIIALKAGLLGASFEGIDRVLVITGDPMSKTEHHSAGAVFDFNSFELIQFIRTLNTDVFSHHPFHIGGALNVNAVNFSAELTRAKRKVECGASFLLTQPIYSQQAAENFLLARRELPCKLLAGILPVASLRNAMFLVNEVSGIHIPASVLERLRDCPPEAVMDVSLDYAMDMVRRVYAHADGFYLMTPLKKVAFIEELIRRIRALDAAD